MSDLSQFDLTGKRALITGSSRGIGFALARGLGRAGAEILVNGRAKEALGDAAATLSEEGLKVTALAFDVCDSENVDAAIEHTESEIGPIDILVNNAGMQHRAPLEDYPAAKFDQLMQTNVNSVFYVGKAVARGMIRRGAGRIINICSVMSMLARPTIAPYVTSKGAVANLTKGMATDWAKYGINVNGIAPGYFATELNDALVKDAAFSEWLAKRTPMARWGNVGELVGAAVFLSSDASSFVNGHILYVDGGITASV